MSADRLFDPAPFSKRGRTARDERSAKKRETPPVTEVVVGDVWKMLANGGGVHAVRNDRYTYCNKVINGTLSLDFGTKAAGCAGCIAAGAPR